MKLTKAKIALSTSVLAMAVIAAPLSAQEKQQTDSAEESDDSGLETATKVGVGAAGVYAASKLVKPHRDPAPDMRPMTPEEQLRNNIVGNNGSVSDLERRGNIAQEARAKRTAATAAADDMATLEARGNAARGARANAVAGSADDLAQLETRGNAAQGSRAARVAGSADDVANLDARGRLAQQIRANKVATPNGTSALASPETAGRNAQAARANAIAGSADDLARLEARGNAARGARANAVAGSADDLTRLEARGNAAQNPRFQARNVNAAARGGPSFDRSLQGRLGPEGTTRLIGQGDAAQAARGRVVNEGQLARNINNAGGDVGRLNQAGRNAQAGRGVGRVAGSADDLARIASTGAKVGRVGRAGRAALAATGAGAIAVAAEYAATEGVKALTGAEIQDPFSTGFQYGAAIFDDDVTIRDVMQARREHHRENFRALGDTLTTEGKWVDNLEAYGDSKHKLLGDAVRFYDKMDRDKRELTRQVTGIELERMTDVGSRYLGALKEERKLQALGDVAKSRAEHHLGNAAALLDKTRNGAQTLGTGARQGLSTVTGADLRSVGETTDRYAEALKGPNKIENLAEVAGDRARHHIENTKKVGDKVKCGIGNLFRKKEDDKDC